MCNCIMCHAGREAWERYGDGDFVPLAKAIEVIRAYDLSQSPYPLSEETRQELISYLEKATPKGILHFETMEEFFFERDMRELARMKANNGNSEA